MVTTTTRAAVGDCVIFTVSQHSPISTVPVTTPQKRGTMGLFFFHNKCDNRQEKINVVIAHENNQNQLVGIPPSINTIHHPLVHEPYLVN